MEEKKSKSGKTVSMNAQSSREGHKLTYEQLNEACQQLYQQNQMLTRQLQQANLTNMFRRLDYLFQVLQHSLVIDDKEFVKSCVEEIKSALTIREEEEQETPQGEEG